MIDKIPTYLISILTTLSLSILRSVYANGCAKQLHNFRNQISDPTKTVPLHMNRQAEFPAGPISTAQQRFLVPDTTSQLFDYLGDPDSALRPRIADGHRAWRIMAELHNTSQSDEPTDTPLLNDLPNSSHGEKQSVRSMEYERETGCIKGDMKCPFSVRKELPLRDARFPSDYPTTTARLGRLPTPPDPKDDGGDPIEAELHRPDFSPPPSATGSASKCPIRFLDQHSPEDVAKYFESHKHEIPRSHEICVKRYQSNEASIRQLDAKYGNLVNMIQGLGIKHKPLLPQNADQTSQVEEHSSARRVEAWAEEVNVVPHDAVAEQTPLSHAAEERESRFDRDMKEIRVGESSSRPWGISVPNIPYVEGLALSMTSTSEHDDRDAHTISDDRPDQVRPAGSCPINRDASPRPRDSSSHKESHFATESSPPRIKSGKQRSQPQMSFTGPIFIGYPPEQMAMLLREYRSGTEQQ